MESQVKIIRLTLDDGPLDAHFLNNFLEATRPEYFSFSLSDVTTETFDNVIIPSSV